ncbi:MAG: hypothetical protein AMXMBFR58_38990 [Phycisphaerae bacterium]
MSGGACSLGRTRPLHRRAAPAVSCFHIAGGARAGSSFLSPTPARAPIGRGQDGAQRRAAPRAPPRGRQRGDGQHDVADWIRSEQSGAYRARITESGGVEVAWLVQ